MGPFPPTPFATYADAVAAIANQTDNCIGFCDFRGGDTGLFFSASFSGTTITVTTTNALSSPSLALGTQVYFSVSLKSGAVLTIPWSLSTDGPQSAVGAALLYCADGSLADSDSIPPNAGSGGVLTLTAPADGEYIFGVSGLGTLGFVSFLDFSFTVTCSMDFDVNPIIAQWDDSGTTRNLWACPKLLLPIGTETSGTWYVDCAAAAAVLSDPLKVSNCVGFCPGAPGLASFTATNGGSSLTLAQTLSPAQANAATMYGGINAVAGQTLSFAFSTNATTPLYLALVLDDAGNIVEFIGPSGSSPLVSSPLPYTGRYTVAVIAGDTHVPAAMTSVSVTVTSSGAMSVNPVQARYDSGLVCAGTLDCGDACP